MWYDADLYPFGAEQYVYTNTCPQNYKFTGKERDAETGLDEFGARYYASFLGRFVTPDWAAKPTAVPYAKFGDPQTLNLYSYVENSPVNRADADGHCGQDVTSCKKLPNDPGKTVPLPVKQAINASVKASNAKNADDKKGGQHEEGGIAYTGKGTQTVAPAVPGKAQDVKSGKPVEMDPYKSADPSKTKPGDVQADVVWHVHPSATAETTTTNAQGQTVVTTSAFSQPPSAQDIQAASPAPTLNLVIGARDNNLYVYDNSDCVCKESMKDFNKEGPQ